MLFDDGSRLTIAVPTTVMRQLKDAAYTKDTTIRIIVLEAPRLRGFNVSEDEVADKRTRVGARRRGLYLNQP